MSSTPPPGGLLLVEPLEARIAPTGLVAIANNPTFAGSTNPFYVTYGTAPTADHLGFVKASTLLGASAPANLYAIKLTGDGSVNADGTSTGDQLRIFNAVTGFNPSDPFIQATDKTVIAFFQDLNGDGQVQGNELVGLSLTKKSSVNVNGSVNGDIVTNLSKDGTTISLTSVGKPGFAIASMTIQGNVTGNILAGGGINNVNVEGDAHSILAGTATNGVSYNFTGNAGAVTGTIAEGAFPVAKPGATISNLQVNSLASGATIHAGDGGLGAVGGNILTLAVLEDTAGFNVLAGNGGVGDGTTKGGFGGDISGVTIVGVAGTTNNALINLHAGNGGENDAFKGGNGGEVTGVGTNFNVFDASSNTGTPSADFLTQNLLVHAGDGGAGLRGGRGGDVSLSSIISAAPDDGVVVNGLANAEIQVVAGHGGLPVVAGQGHGGKGGNVTQIFAEDLHTDTLNADGTTTFATDSVLVQAGDGGAGKDGGNLDTINLLGAALVANAGNGADGINTGGPGGSVNTVNVLNTTNLFTHQLAVNAGSGGASQMGAGGAGGDVTAVTMNDSDLFNLPANPATGLLGQQAIVINGGTHANGGVGTGGVGGSGGMVTGIQITDSDVSLGFASVAVRSGTGGNGLDGGGVGGDIGNSTAPVQMFGLNFAYTVTAGAGGSILNGGAGTGGSGGNLDTVGFSNVPSVDQIFVGSSIASALGGNYGALTGTATAGAGGNGTTRGGMGGDLGGVDLRGGFDLTLTAGAGGAGGSSVGGDGGTITASAGISLGGAVSLIAGNGSGGGSFATNGGAIIGSIASAQTDITMLAGNGGVGGNGGDITGSGTTPNPLYVDTIFNATTFVATTATTSNFGNVTITAGNGSAANGVAGTGGSVTTFTGSIGLAGSGDLTSFANHTTAITAGNGGGGNGQTQSGAGGSVDQLTLAGNSLTDFFGGQFLTVDGGNAGVSSAAKRGAAGGGVSNVTISNLDFDTFFQHVAAGDGANALNRGGAGGTITEIHVGRPGDVDADIGIRDGETFGYGPGFAGGIFAGVGGTGSKSTGVNGDVTDVTAAAISSIVAGKGSTIHLVNTVDGIDLEGGTLAAPNADGSFSNFDTANVVGSIQDPTAAGASTYHAGDGLVAATNFTSNRNFFAQAALTYDVNGVLEFFDYQQPTVQPVVTTAIPFSFSAPTSI